MPFIISWKGRLESGRTESRPIIQLDLMPTVLAAAGLRLEPLAMTDGVNLLPYLTGNAGGRPHETLYGESAERWRFARATGNW